MDAIEILNDLVASTCDTQDTRHGILSPEELDAVHEAIDAMQAIDNLWARHQEKYQRIEEIFGKYQ